MADVFLNNKMITNILFFSDCVLAHSTGGLFALGAATKSDENSERYMQIGKDITSTCHESYIRTATQLGPDRFR